MIYKLHRFLVDYNVFCNKWEFQENLKINIAIPGYEKVRGKKNSSRNTIRSDHEPLHKQIKSKSNNEF